MQQESPCSVLLCLRKTQIERFHNIASPVESFPAKIHSAQRSMAPVLARRGEGIKAMSSRRNLHCQRTPGPAQAERLEVRRLLATTPAAELIGALPHESQYINVVFCITSDAIKSVNV